MKKKLLIIGTGITAKHVYDFVSDYQLYQVVGFAVDGKYKKTDYFCNLPVYEIEETDRNFQKDEIEVFIAVLWNRLNAERRDLYYRFKEKGYTMANIISPTAVIRGKIAGDNCWIHDYVVIQSDAVIHSDCLLMAYVLVGANAILGAHCFLGTKSTVAGGSTVGEQCFIGINCTVFDDTKIGEKCILGACSIVKRNVESYSIVKTKIDFVTQIQLDEQCIEEKLQHKQNVR